MLQCNWDGMNKIFSLPWTGRLAPSSSAKKCRKDVVSITHTATAATLHGFLSPLIIKLPFRFVGQNLVGRGNFFELLFKCNLALQL